MPEPTATPIPSAQPTPTPDPAPTDTPPDDDAFTSDRQRRRFAELSGRVGTRERERDEARSRVDQLLTREAERLAGLTLSEPSDLWLDGTHVADMLTEDGSDVDPGKVKAVIDALVAKRPGLRKPPAVQPLHGIHGVQMPIGEKPSLESAVRRIARGRAGMP